MSTPVLGEDHPDALTRAVAALEAGQPIVIPTDTVYGLAVRAEDRAGIERIFELKDRPEDRAIATLVADTAQAAALAQLGTIERRLADRLWPGALTLVVPALDAVRVPTADDNTVGLRVPDREFVRRLASVVGPLATTSANRSNHPTAPEAVPAAESLMGPVRLVIDGGACHGQASTVVRCHPDRIEVLRAGRLAPAGLAEVAGVPIAETGSAGGDARREDGAHTGDQ